MFEFLRIGFVLPSAGGGGGANSVVQEAVGLTRLGVQVALLIDAPNMSTFRKSYPELQDTDVQLAPFGDATELGRSLGGLDVACATTALSVEQLKAGLAAIPAGLGKPKTAYYVQDYEPLFYGADTTEWKKARQSYTLIPGMTLFAKTDWVCAVVQQNHDVAVTRVKASLDHGIYYPQLRRNAASKGLRISAMLRPKTRRRAPIRTGRLLQWLFEEFGESVQTEVFGANDDDLSSIGIYLQPNAHNRGPLRRSQVPDLLRNSDLFLDLSDYQAFGRTGLEAMASGCTPLLPVLGGASEYAIDGFNALVVDTRSDDAVKAAVRGYVDMSDDARAYMRLNGLSTASRYGVPQAVTSLLGVFSALTSRGE